MVRRPEGTGPQLIGRGWGGSWVQLYAATTCVCGGGGGVDGGKWRSWCVILPGRSFSVFLWFLEQKSCFLLSRDKSRRQIFISGQISIITSSSIVINWLCISSKRVNLVPLSHFSHTAHRLWRLPALHGHLPGERHPRGAVSAPLHLLQEQDGRLLPRPDSSRDQLTG